MTTSITSPTEIFVPNYLKLQEILAEHERAHWVPDEAQMQLDVEQWKTGIITDKQKAFIKMILRLFTQADTNVCASYVERLLPIFKNADARMMLLSFANREVTHMLGYKRLNDTLGYDSHEFMSEFLSFKEMKDKHDFMVEDVDLSTPVGIAEYLAKQVLMEGVNLFASFAMLLSFAQGGILPGMVSINQWSVADESLHVKGLCEAFRIYLAEHPSVVTNAFKKKIYQTARDVIRLEDTFIDLVFGVGESGFITKEEAKAYPRYVCDYRMQQLGLKTQFGVDKNPIGWIDYITGNTFGNFFETTVIQYSKNSMTGEWVY
ncbi:MAG TPA: ribonucleotide-diphosphate reductase subunit beta [Methanosarcina sp.]|nr:ribonucleotide-diphosphate reductase subunit beta [Methanosarcina sp.]